MLSRPMIDRIAFGPVTWYAVLIVFAVAVGYFLAQAEARKQKLPHDLLLDFLLYALPLGVIGARLYYVFFRFNDYSEDLLSILWIHEGGLAIYGGIIGGLLAARIVCRKYRVPYLQLLDILAPSLVLGQAIGRWGNYLNMEAYGLRVSEEAFHFFPLAVEIPVGEIWYWHLATFFYEFCADLLIFLILLAIRKKRHAHGDVFFWYVLLYTSARTIIEGLRDDSLTFISDFVRISQVFSGLAALAIIIYFFLRIRDRISLVTTLPLISAVLCIVLTFLGEFERNAYSTLFKYAQLLLLLLMLLQIVMVFMLTIDSRHFELRLCLPLILCAVMDGILLLFGLGRANEDNTYYVTFRQCAAMLQVCIAGGLLTWGFNPAPASNRNGNESV